MMEWVRFGYIREDIFRPNLESLEMCGCTFFSDFELKLILRLKHSLRSLKFDDCEIIHCLRLDPGNPVESRSNAWNVAKKAGLKLQIGATRWHEWFDKFRASLLHLSSFQFGSSRIRDPREEGPVFESERVKGPRFGEQPKFLLGLFPDRYLEMEQKIMAAPWVLDPPNRTYKKRPQCDEADQFALSLLLEYTKQQVDVNCTSDHAGYVEDLLGHVKPCEDV